MSAAPVSEFVVECLWPDVRDSDLRMLDERVRIHAGRLALAGCTVGYIGSMLMREDEVVLCLFEGELDAVREVAKAAELPFERIVEMARSPWNLHDRAEHGKRTDEFIQ